MPSRANEYCSAPLTSGDEGGSDVTSVTVVVRHGARSGIATEVQDWKCGLGALKAHVKRWEAASGNELTPETSNGTCKKGQLVARGFRQHKRLGAFLRSRYGGTAWQVTTRSTNYQRTKASASAFLDGFFGGRMPKDAWPSFRENASEEPMFGVEGAWFSVLFDGARRWRRWRLRDHTRVDASRGCAEASVPHRRGRQRDTVRESCGERQAAAGGLAAWRVGRRGL
jgi:hypothetical protein